MKLITLFIFVLFINGVAAQQTFLIYRINGNVKLKGGNQKEPVKIGQLLKGNNAIWLDKGASVVLICEGYNSFTIRKSGNHTMAAYSDSCRNEERSVSSAYFKYIWSELTHPHTTPENNRRKYMQNTGAVVRGCPGIEIDPVYDTIYNNAGDVKIQWHTTIPATQLSFVLYESEKDGRPLYKKAVTENYIHLDTLKKYKGGNAEVYWNITINGNEMCNRRMIQFWDNADYTVFKAELNRSMKTILNTAERYYATGFTLEANHFLAEALEYYKKASSMQPSAVKYQQPLADF